MSNIFDEDYETPRSCIKNKKWELPKAIEPLEDCLKKYENSGYLETSKWTHLKSSNLTKLQHNCFNFLRNNKQYVIMISDKNTGSCVANRNECIATMINQHFCNTHVYERI